MPADRVVIEDLVLRLPGVTRDSAVAIARAVAERIGRGLADAMPLRSLGALDLRVAVRPELTRDELIDQLAQTILGAITR